MKNPWLSHVRKTLFEHPGISLPIILKKANKTYKLRKGNNKKIKKSIKKIKKNKSIKKSKKKKKKRKKKAQKIKAQNKIITNQLWILNFL